MEGIRASSRVMMIGLAVACGPSAGDGTDAEPMVTSTGTSADSTTGSGPTTGLSQTLGDPESTGAHESSTTSGAAGESSSSTTSPCGCGFVRIPADEPSPDGYSFADLVAELPVADHPWVWTAIDGEPTTTIQLTFEVMDTALWADDGCGGISPSCRGLEGRVTVTITSADGLLAETLVGFIDGVLEENAQLDVGAERLRTFAGTLPDATFVDENGDPIDVFDAGVRGLWSWERGSPEGTFAVATGFPLGIVLGESAE
jgi:hypothetical protein